MISQKPTVKAVLAKIEAEELKFTEDLIDRVVNDAVVIDIKQIAEKVETTVSETETVEAIDNGNVVIDIRAQDEEEQNPLKIDDTEI